MADAEIVETGIARAAARFPQAKVALRWLALTDAEFCEICEEYALAITSLAAFEARPDAAERPEIDDYRQVIAEIESEIDRRLREFGRI